MRSLGRSKLSTFLLTAMVAVAWGQPGAADEAGDSTVGLEPGGSGFALHEPPALAPQHAEAIEIAEVYLFDGLVNHDVEATRAALADDAQRTEQGFNTGDGGDAIADSLGADVFLVITGIDNLKWIVECAKDGSCQAASTYDLEILSGMFPPVLISERFLVADGLIQEIEAIFVIQEEFGRCNAACFPDTGLGH
jgi:hypothetical protein